LDISCASVSEENSSNAHRRYFLKQVEKKSADSIKWPYLNSELSRERPGVSDIARLLHINI
jgi:hypothetical protein